MKIRNKLSIDYETKLLIGIIVMTCLILILLASRPTPIELFERNMDECLDLERYTEDQCEEIVFELMRD